MLTVFDCPGDGTCSGQGTCDGTTGTCVCFEGFERASDTCKGTYWLCLGKSHYTCLKFNILILLQMCHVLV